MSDFSIPPAVVLRQNRDKGYTGVHIEQGVPILDRDLNLMHDLLESVVRTMFARYIGDGIPTTDGDPFAIRALPDGQNENNFQIIGPGTCLAGGLEATIEATTDYKNQPHASLLPPDDRPADLTVPSGDTRTDTVYLEIFLVEVSGTTDLDNHEDIGMQTSVRVKPAWVVKVAESMRFPPLPEGRKRYALAQLVRPRGDGKITDGPISDTNPAPRMTDVRQQRLTVSTLESRLSLLEKELFAPSFDINVAEQIEGGQGKIGRPLKLKGKNFDKGNIEVLFGNVPAAITQRSATVLMVAVPGGVTLAGVASDVRLTVRNQIGAAVSARKFKVTPEVVFTDPEFRPDQGESGDPVSLFGFNFTPDKPTVTFTAGNTSVTTPVLVGSTHTELKVKVPQGFNQQTDVKIKIAFPAGDPRKSVESTKTFRVLPG